MLTFLHQTTSKNLLSSSFPNTPILATVLAYITTFVLMFVGNIIGTLPLIGFVFLELQKQGKGMEDFEAALKNPSSMGIDPNTVFLCMLLTFVFTLLFLWVGVKFVHQRPILSMVNGNGKMRWGRFWTAFGVWFAITAAMELVNYALHPQAYQLTFEATPFLITFLIALLVLPFQTSCEEFVFRGWLMQAIGSIGVKPWVAVAVTGTLFGAMHFNNPEVAKFGIAPMAVYYVGFGIFMGLVTILDDGLELALGLHFGNNFFGATMVSFTSSALQTCTLFRTEDPDAYLLLALSIVGASTAFFIFKKMYNFAPINVLFESPQKEI